MSSLGPQALVRRDLKSWLMLQSWKRVGEDHWLARPPSKRVAVEVVGSPVRQISVMVPIARGAGEIVGQVINTYATQEARLWAAEELRLYGDNVKEPIDVSREFGEVEVRVQSMLLNIVLTIRAREEQ